MAAKKSTDSLKKKKSVLNLQTEAENKTENVEAPLSMEDFTLYSIPYTTIARSEFQEQIDGQKTKRINLSLDNMLSASKVLSTIKNDRTLDLTPYPDPVKNYVARVIKSRNISEELTRLNLQIAAKISKD